MTPGGSPRALSPKDLKSLSATLHFESRAINCDAVFFARFKSAQKKQQHPPIRGDNLDFAHNCWITKSAYSWAGYFAYFLPTTPKCLASMSDGYTAYNWPARPTVRWHIAYSQSSFILWTQVVTNHLVTLKAFGDWFKWFGVKTESAEPVREKPSETKRVFSKASHELFIQIIPSLRITDVEMKADRLLSPKVRSSLRA